jgi:hypothetical protein
MIACKLKANHIIPDAYFEQFNNIVRFAYNYRKKIHKAEKSLSLSTLEQIVKDNMHHKDLMDTSLIKLAVNKSKSMDIEKNIIFAKKEFKALKYFNQRKEHNTLEDRLQAQKAYYIKKNNTILLRGSSLDYHGNRKAKLDLERNMIIFKASKEHHFEIRIENDRRLPQLKLLQHLCEKGLTFFTLEITRNSVSVIYDENILPKKKGKIRKDRILALDMNPNQLGILIKNTQDHVFHKEILDLTQLNLKTLKNKNKKLHETAEIAMHVIRLAKHYQCGTIAHEDLNIKAKNFGKGRYFNRLCNNAWNRTRFLEILCKHACLNGLEFLAIKPAYSSFVGCLMHQEFDAIAAAMEIHRRASNQLQKGQYCLFPEDQPSHHATRWKDKLGERMITISWKQLYSFCKESRLSYRILFSPKKPFEGSSFSLKSSTSLTTRHVLSLDSFVNVLNNCSNVNPTLSTSINAIIQTL